MTRRTRIAVVLVIFASIPGWTLAQRRGAKAKRVAPPKFEQSKTDEYFFSNVFSVLRGDRPDLTKSAQATGGPAGQSQGGGGTANNSVAGWAAAISSETIEDEVKAIKTGLDKTITTPGAFNGGGFKTCRREFTTAAMLFGIIHEYDGDVRFKKNASGLRDALARTGRNCKVGTTQVYNESKIRRADLQDVIGGGAYQGKEGDPDITWDKICDRTPLMQRLEEANNKRIQPALSNAAEFKKNKDMLRHEAELVAAISKVLVKEGMEDGDYEDYMEFCESMEQAGRDIADAVKQDNYEAARKAGGAISQACTTCHENYRG